MPYLKPIAVAGLLTGAIAAWHTVERPVAAPQARCSAPAANDHIYAITKAVSRRSHQSAITVVQVRSWSECERVLNGKRLSSQDPYNPMLVESARCESKITEDICEAFSDMPTENAYVVSYRSADWPTRSLFYELDQRTPKSAMCSMILAVYRRMDSNARCTPPAVLANHTQAPQYAQ